MEEWDPAAVAAADQHLARHALEAEHPSSRMFMDMGSLKEPSGRVLVAFRADSAEETIAVPEASHSGKPPGPEELQE